MLTSEILISVTIPLFNKAHTIGRAISSVLSQTERRFELIIVDDGSTDDSVELVSQFSDPRITLISQENAGPGYARNVGAHRSTGPYLAFLDADDEWEPEFLRSALCQLQRNPQAQAYVCGYDAGQFKMERPNKVMQLGLSGCSSISPDTDKYRLKQHVDAMHSSCTMIRRDVFNRLGGYYTKDACRYGEDSYLWLAVLLSGPVVWDPDELTKFHVEDSDLGFATSMRTEARPISTDGMQLESLILPEMKPALKRAIQAYIEMDLALLLASGAFPQARELRKRQGDNSLFTYLLDSFRARKFAAKRIVRRVAHGRNVGST